MGIVSSYRAHLPKERHFSIFWNTNILSKGMDIVWEILLVYHLIDFASQLAKFSFWTFLFWCLIAHRIFSALGLIRSTTRTTELFWQLSGETGFALCTLSARANERSPCYMSTTSHLWYARLSQCRKAVFSLRIASFLRSRKFRSTLRTDSVIYCLIGWFYIADGSHCEVCVRFKEFIPHSRF